MVTFVLYGCAAVGAVTLTVILLICAAIAVSDVVRRVRSLRMRRLERLRPIGDPDADEVFGDLAQELLDDPAEPRLAEVCEELGWMR